MTREFRRTKKQTAIIGIILAAADHGALTSLEVLRVGLPHGMKVSKQAIRSSLKFLQDHGYVESVKAGTYTLYKPTPKAYTEFRSSP